jgi:hypothetical protein
MPTNIVGKLLADLEKETSKSSSGIVHLGSRYDRGIIQMRSIVDEPPTNSGLTKATDITLKIYNCETTLKVSEAQHCLCDTASELNKSIQRSIDKLNSITVEQFQPGYVVVKDYLPIEYFKTLSRKLLNYGKY